MQRNYLKRVEGDKINTLLTSAAYNMKTWMIRRRVSISDVLRFFGCSVTVLTLEFYKSQESTKMGNFKDQLSNSIVMAFIIAKEPIEMERPQPKGFLS